MLNIVSFRTILEKWLPVYGYCCFQSHSKHHFVRLKLIYWLNIGNHFHFWLGLEWEWGLVLLWLRLLVATIIIVIVLCHSMFALPENVFLFCVLILCCYCCCCCYCFGGGQNPVHYVVYQLTAHNWQNRKRRPISIPHMLLPWHVLNLKEEAVVLKSPNYLLKMWFLWICEIWDDLV